MRYQMLQAMEGCESCMQLTQASYAGSLADAAMRGLLREITGRATALLSTADRETDGS